MKLSKKLLLIAMILVSAYFIVNVISNPAWRPDWWEILVTGLVGVVNFIANFRQAFEIKQSQDNRHSPVCQDCGHVNHVDSRFCEKCGHYIIERSSPMSNRPVQAIDNSNGGKSAGDKSFNVNDALPIVAIVIAAIVVVGLVVLVIVLKLAGGNPPSLPQVVPTQEITIPSLVPTQPLDPATASTENPLAGAQESDTSCSEIGQTYTSQKDGMPLLCVPAGEFTMGRDDAGMSDQKPAHVVYVDSFWIDKTEVTNQMYSDCVSAGVCALPTKTENYLDRVTNESGYGQRPVVYISWDDAQKYCNWVGRRLPTEAEWEKAARGIDQRLYPWGNTWESDRANYCDVNCENDGKDSSHNDGHRWTAPVGTYPDGASPYGALDMAGNVDEWVSDWYDEDYYTESEIDNPTGPLGGDYRVVRGGSWFYESFRCQTTDRRLSGQSNVTSYIGFRCAVSP